jgi:hypothetical protein
MSNMRQRILSMTRRVQERPCWLQEDVLSDNDLNDTIEQLVKLKYFQKLIPIQFLFIL